MHVHKCKILVACMEHYIVQCNHTPHIHVCTKASETVMVAQEYRLTCVGVRIYIHVVCMHWSFERPSMHVHINHICKNGCWNFFFCAIYGIALIIHMSEVCIRMIVHYAIEWKLSKEFHIHVSTRTYTSNLTCVEVCPYHYSICLFTHICLLCGSLSRIR